MGDIYVTVNITVQGDKDYGDTGGGYGLFDISATILYLLGFIGIGIMLVNVISTPMAFAGILALLIYALPLLAVALAGFKRLFASGNDDDDFGTRLVDALCDGGSVIKNIFKNFIAPYAYVLFNVFVALFWICNPIGAISEVTLSGLVFICAYSMYYFPIVLFAAAKRLNSKLLRFATVGIIISSLAVFLINYGKYGVEGFALFLTMIIVLGTLAILISNLVLSKKKVKPAAFLALFLALAIAVGSVSAFLLPGKNEEKYNQAIACVESGDYRQARELFLELGRYEDAEQRYNEIKFTNLQVGEQLSMGTQLKKPDSNQYDQSLSWTVIAVNGNQALLFSDAILTSIDSNALSLWNKSNSVRGQLKNLEYVFSDSETARIAEHSYTIQTESGQLQATDRLFLLSQSELLAYCSNEQIFSKKDTSYNDHQVLSYMMQDYDYEYVYSYYVRNTDDSGEWIIADCDSDQFTVKSNRYVGVRPAFYITMDVK